MPATNEAQRFTELMSTYGKGYVPVEEQKGEAVDLKLHPSVQEQLLPPEPPVDENEVGLEPETFVFSASGFPPDQKKQNCPFHLIVRAGFSAPNSVGQVTVQELPLVASFEGPGYRYTTPTVEAQQAALFTMMRRRGDSVKDAKKESVEAAKQDIRDIKLKLFTCLEWRAGKVRRIADVNRPQAQDAVNAMGTIRALQDAGIDVRALLGQAGIDLASIPVETADEEGEEPNPRASKRIPAHPQSNMG